MNGSPPSTMYGLRPARKALPIAHQIFRSHCELESKKACPRQMAARPRERNRATTRQRNVPSSLITCRRGGGGIGEGRKDAVLSPRPSSLIPFSATRTRRGCATPLRTGRNQGTGTELSGRGQRSLLQRLGRSK